MNARRAGRALAVVVLLVAGACSGDDAPDGGEAADGGSGGAVMAPSVTSGGAGLGVALLTLDDLPAGMVPLGPPFETCGMRTEMPDVRDPVPFPAAGAAFAFSAEAAVPDVFETIVAVPAGGGPVAFERARALLDGCGTGGEVDGVVHRHVADLAVPELGEESFGRRVTVEVLATGVSLDVDVAYARAGDTIVVVGVVAAEDGRDMLASLATTAFGRATR